MTKDFSKLQRDIHPMPSFVQEALEVHRLMQAYLDRPAYQQNDYIGWINRAKQDATKQKRLSQMLSELEQGGVYMKMPHPASRKNRGPEKQPDIT
ncbi:YdeI/OmpD-associated family protein [Motiliproteus sp. SC1-56]|uniref:YdeI/OmpD-associated family protein n=1 Tax=Motiliproteus sp. SC1-56 TaxID=2799565 RepID=UPI001A90852C|nr:YdeI/OmpD-associated family protein [Motiliproteus sp. SC1-56]